MRIQTIMTFGERQCFPSQPDRAI